MSTNYAVLFLRFGLRNLDLVQLTCDGVVAIHAAPDAVAVWDETDKIGRAWAPRVDELRELMKAEARTTDPDPAVFKQSILDALPKQRDPAAAPRDGRWLQLGIDFAKILLPILLAKYGGK